MLVYGANTHKRDENEGLGVHVLPSRAPSICPGSIAGETLWVTWSQELNSSSSVLGKLAGSKHHHPQLQLLDLGFSPITITTDSLRERAGWMV